MRFKMAQIRSWKVSGALWSKIEPLVPARERPPGREYQRKPRAGRKPMPARQVFSAMVYVLRTGCRWKALPKEYGSSSAVHAHFQLWRRAAGGICSCTRRPIDGRMIHTGASSSTG